MSVADMFRGDLLDKTATQTVELPVSSQDMLEGLDHKIQEYDKTNHNGNWEANGLLNGSQCDNKPVKNKNTFSTGHLDFLANNTVWESDDGTKNSSLDSQMKRFDSCLPKADVNNRGKRNTEHQPLKGRRLLHVSPELEFVEEEDLSENEDSSEEDSMDNTLHFSSKDGVDKKERHQYVSDKLDPDVLHLLEMHLRKQQLVDIKEEGEEEPLDVHINKEKPRSDSYKLLRNISPVLDMVLEEPELEHAGDMLEDDSKTPSDIDSDDSSHVSSIEVGLMESLQYDLMSKSSKIDKHEIATILQGPDTNVASHRSKTKQHASFIYLGDCKSTNVNVQRKEPKTPISQMRDSGDLEVIHEDRCEDAVSEIVSEDVLEAAHIEYNASGSLNDTQTSSAEENCLADSSQDDQSSNVTSSDQDLGSDVTQQIISEVGNQATYMVVREDKSFLDSETALPDSDSVTSDDALGSLCPSSNGDVTLLATCLESTVTQVIQELDSSYPNNEDFKTEIDSSEQQDVVDTALPNLDKDQKVIKETVKSQTEAIVSEELLCSSADMNTLQEDIKQKILSLLEKAHAADCRSSHLQAEAELLFKQSIELRNECQSLSKEAAELLSMVTQQGLLHRHQMGQSIQKAKAEEHVCTTETKSRNKTKQSYINKRNQRNKKGEGQVQDLSKKYYFLKEEGPEIMRELHVLQQDLKNLPPRHSKQVSVALGAVMLHNNNDDLRDIVRERSLYKPINFLYKWLWGGLIAGSTMFLVLWSMKQFG